MATVNPAYWTSTEFPPGAGNGPVGPYLVPPYLPVTYTAPLDIWVAAVCAPNTTTGTTGIQPTTGQPAFTLAFVPSPVAGDTSVYAKVSVGASFAWSADDTVRRSLSASFIAFRALLETLEVKGGSTTGGLLAGTAEIVANRIATSMPLRYDETLTYLYGANASLQYVDILPGMTLRAEWSGYQYCDGPNGAGYASNAFVGAGTGRFTVTRRFDHTLALDAYLGGLTPGYALNVPAPCPLYAAGLVDLQLAANARRHLRLFFPNTISGAGSLDNAGTFVQSGSRLIGADTYADLEAATLAVVNGQDACGTASSGNQPVVNVIFNGRVVIVPEIVVFFGGVPTPASLGTTLRNLLDRIADAAPSQYFKASGSNLWVTLSRWNQRPNAPVLQNWNVYTRTQFDWTSSSVVATTSGDCFDIPLAKGDVVQLPNIGSDPLGAEGVAVGA